MWAAEEPGLQPEVVLPDLQSVAAVYYSGDQESGKPAEDDSANLTQFWFISKKKTSLQAAAKGSWC